MSEISELEQRILTALDRIRAGVSTMELARGAALVAEAEEAETAAADADGLAAKDAEIARLTEALEKEKAATATFEDRVTALKERQDTKLADLEASVTEARAQVASFESVIEELREANAELRETSEKLREGAEGGVADASLINLALKAELEALTAAQRADSTEINAVLKELKPILEEGA